MKMPWLKFYVRDWLSDPQLRMVSLAARGFWMECICLMHQAKRSGYLETPSGKPIKENDLARLTGTFIGELKGLQTELLEHGIPSVDDYSGVWYCRRMVKEYMKASKCSEAGRRGGGNPALLKNQESEKTIDQRSDTTNRIKGTYIGGVYGSDADQSINNPTLESCIEASATLDMRKSDVEAFFHHYNSIGWVDAQKRPIRSLASALAKWKANESNFKRNTIEAKSDEWEKAYREIAESIWRAQAENYEGGVKRAMQKARDTYGDIPKKNGVDVVNAAIGMAMNNQRPKDWAMQ